MFLLREPMWWLLLSAAVGYVCGKAKGRPGLGVLLGLLFGPFGTLAIMLWPPAKEAPRTVYRQSGFRSAPAEDAGGCPRCGRPVGGRAKACPHCGNLLMPIRYAVEGGASSN